MNALRDFKQSKYGLQMRLVEVADAEFIVSLRSDSKLSQYLHSTDNDIAKQQKWIIEYKKREALGLEYYFIFHKDERPCGVERIYNITSESFTIGSWIFKKDIDPDIPILANLLTKSLAFDLFPDKTFLFDVRKGNRKVIKYQKLFNPTKIGEDDLNLYYKLSVENYRKAEQRLLSALNY